MLRDVPMYPAVEGFAILTAAYCHTLPESDQFRIALLPSESGDAPRRDQPSA
jgi:hypothetical protein